MVSPAPGRKNFRCEDSSVPERHDRVVWLLVAPFREGGHDMRNLRKALLVMPLIALLAGCAAPLNTREKGGLLGGALGAGTGAIIGSATGHAAAGAAIGGPIGLLAGGLIGDQLLGREREDARLQAQINAQQAELRRQRAEIRRLKKQQRR
jgi:hypothetical protein